MHKEVKTCGESIGRSWQATKDKIFLKNELINLSHLEISLQSEFTQHLDKNYSQNTEGIKKCIQYSVHGIN